MAESPIPLLPDGFFDLLGKLDGRIGRLERSRSDDRFDALVEMETTPALPPGADAVLFVRDNGSGKTQLCVIFATGAPIVLATQP